MDADIEQKGELITITTVKKKKKQVIQDRYAIKLNLLTGKKISVNVKDIDKKRTYNGV